MVMIGDNFCKRCGIKIKKGFVGNLGGDIYYEFADGVYCEKCAKLRVDKARGRK